MPETVVRSIGAGRDFTDLAAFAEALPTSLVAADQHWVAELFADSNDPGGAMLQAICDETRKITVRAAAGESFSDLMDPALDPLVATPGSGAMINASTGNGLNVAGGSTRVEVVGLQISAAAGAALADDGAGAFLRVERCVLEADDAAPCASIRGTGAIIRNCAVVQRGVGDGVALSDGAAINGCSVAKPARDLADGFGVTANGIGVSAEGTFCFGFRQAFGPGLATADRLISDQINVIAAPDDFSDASWTAVSSTVDPMDTIPGPFNVPLQWLGNNQNSFSSFLAPAISSVPVGGIVEFSAIIAQPTSLLSALLLNHATAGRPEVRVSWSTTPPTVSTLGATSAFRLISGTLTDLGSDTWRLHLVAENGSGGPIDVTPIFYVARGVENSGLNIGMYAGNVMAGLGHLGSGFVYPGAHPGTNAIEGADPDASIEALIEGAEDLRPLAGGVLDGTGDLATEPDIYNRHRLAPDTAGAATANPADVIAPRAAILPAVIDSARLIDRADILSAQRDRIVQPAAPVRRIGI